MEEPTQTDAQDLANKIARLVEERGWNQEEFARIARLNRHTVRQILHPGGRRRLRNATISACARALGLSAWSTFWAIVLPQATRSVLPALLNNFIGLLLYTSIASTIGVHELTYAGGKLNSATFQSVVIFTGVAGLYLILSVAASAGVRRLERVQARRD